MVVVDYNNIYVDVLHDSRALLFKSGIAGLFFVAKKIYNITLCAVDDCKVLFYGRVIDTLIEDAFLMMKTNGTLRVLDS